MACPNPCKQDARTKSPKSSADVEGEEEEEYGEDGDDDEDEAHCERNGHSTQALSRITAASDADLVSDCAAAL
jgi:hypothetical protein